MTTHTYPLAVALQAKAIDTIDTQDVGVHTLAHSFGDHTIVVARHRVTSGQRILQVWAHDRDAHFLGSAQATAPRAGGAITSHVSAFRSAHLRWERRIIPTQQQYLNPAQHTCGSRSANASHHHIGFHACGRADYYLTHDWAPGRSPWRTTWSLLIGTARTGLVVAHSGVAIDTALAAADELEHHHLTAV